MTYNLQTSIIATCQYCGNHVDILFSDLGTMFPRFYICYGCKKVHQISVGNVEKIDNQDP